MPKDEFDGDDPFEIVGMVMPQAGEQTLEDMARCFIEEFVRMGWKEESLLGLFRDPFYQGPHSVFRAKGEDYVRQLISQVIEEWNASWKKG